MTNPWTVCAVLYGTLLLTLVAGCHSKLKHSAISSSDQTADLVKYMTGTFTSSAQHAADPENYRDITLNMAPIWTHRSDGPWLYVEQAMSDLLSQPYRQRVYRLSPHADDSIESQVYLLPDDPLRFAGAHLSSAPLAELSPEKLSLREGCSVFLRIQPDRTYSGATRGESCVSTIAEASYATSDVSIDPDKLISWDRGFSNTGDQVWGATKGGYVFERVDSWSPP